MISNKRTTPTVNVPIVRDPWIIRHNQRRTDGRGSTAKRMEGLNMKADPIGRKSHGSRAAAKTATTDGGQKQKVGTHGAVEAQRRPNSPSARQPRFNVHGPSTNPNGKSNWSRRPRPWRTCNTHVKQEQ